jgi:hypothetical protein
MFHMEWYLVYHIELYLSAINGLVSRNSINISISVLDILFFDAVVFQYRFPYGIIFLCSIWNGTSIIQLEWCRMVSVLVFHMEWYLTIPLGRVGQVADAAVIFHLATARARVILTRHARHALSTPVQTCKKITN